MKQVIVVRKDLKMGQGKIASQAAHASLSAVEKSDRETVEEWKNSGQKKVVLKVGSLEELIEIKEACKKQKIVFAVVKDAGKTQVKSGTFTAIAIGPDKEEKVDRITGHLKML